MPFYLSILASSSTLIAPLNKGSRDYLRLRGLRALASSTATPLALAMQQANPRRFYNDLARGDLAAWRDHSSNLAGRPDSMYTRHHLQLATPLSAEPVVPSALRPTKEDLATVLDALSTGRPLQGGEVKAGELVVPRQVEQATRKSWGRAGLRLSPFDLQQGITRAQ